MISKKEKGGKGWLFLALAESFFIFMFCCSAYGGIPSNVRVTNVRGTQFTVSWTSAEEETGQIKYGTNISSHASWATANDDRGAAKNDDIHQVTITELNPNTAYYYEIISGSTTDNNSGNYYSLNPGPTLIPPDSCQPAGKVFKDQAKTQLAYDSIVYVTILGATEEQNSATESVIVTEDSNGYWFLDFVNFRTKDYSVLYSYTCGTSAIFVEAQGGNDGAANMTTDAVDFLIAERPEMILEPFVNNHTVTFMAEPGGSLTGTTTQTVPHGGDCTAVTAVPDSGHSFTGWSDGVTTNPRTITSVTSDVTLTANFAATGTSQKIFLEKGWNLISFQINKCFYDGDIPTSTVSIPEGVAYEKIDSLAEWLSNDISSPIRDASALEKAGKWQRIISCDQKGSHLLDKDLPPFINDLHYVSLGYGYWIKMNEPGAMIIEGQLAAANTPLVLNKGWNLMGFIAHDKCYGNIQKSAVYPYQSGYYQEQEGIEYSQITSGSFLDTALSSMAGKFERVIAFDPGNGGMIYDPQLPPFVNTLRYLGPKYAYWIKMSEEGILVSE